MYKLMIFTLPFVLLACSPGNSERLKEKTQIESETQSKVEIETQNKRATEMEADLAHRHLFFQAAKGKYEGSFTTDLGTFKIHVLLVPSLNPVKIDRIRLPEEVAADINNLHLNAQIKQWVDGNISSAVGCRVENIRPDLTSGVIQIVSENCSNVYFLALSSSTASREASSAEHYVRTTTGSLSTEISTQIFQGNVSQVEELAGSLQLTNVATDYHFRAKRIE